MFIITAPGGYYTGKAGAEFTSQDPCDATVYPVQWQAERMARALNHHWSGSKSTFAVVPAPKGMVPRRPPLPAPQSPKREFLNWGVENGRHLSPIYRAVRDHGVGFVTVPQTAKPFKAMPGRPTVALMGDDMFVAKGPDAFHRKSLRRFIKTCRAAALVACEPLPHAYLAVASEAVLLRVNGMIIETRPEFEIPWYQFLQEAKPDIHVLWCTVKAGSA